MPYSLEDRLLRATREGGRDSLGDHPALLLGKDARLGQRLAVCERDLCHVADRMDAGEAGFKRARVYPDPGATLGEASLNDDARAPMRRYAQAEVEAPALVRKDDFAGSDSACLVSREEP